ncbi:AEC family transporter [Halomonas sp. FeN2]|jgi:malonate transporter and related proteins|uniref:AEC family transporter n=1 Tax=Vreelandella neptunia TaxID=115551 RepID=A0ABZ0YKK0_9GAMM|nr:MULTISPECIES: AEC family transporter [Halomonas]MBF58878.1 transporter [Halomonas sp.]MBL1268679.1 AEC family transporter [Halomonas sp.]MDN3560431.1 AEC family transporter [Halomonas neptunia]UBR51841.1 AEC family transporter [Halomonas sp. FeN2]WQH12646.1 AEC family transporter [Halomonas neptunia]|tara:strand:+ start:3659 stop:4573 length:915 start_codon:yes stop_codon:yes gene_type:complete
MESITGALGPLFLLILLGAVLGYWRWPSDTFWPHMERLIYFVLFPAMLVGTLATADVNQVPVGRLALVLLGAMALFGLLLWRLRGWLQLTPAAFTSVFQGAVRFNTYVGVAGAAALHGSLGATTAAVAVALMVPVVNVMCVASFVAAGTLGGASVGKSAMALIKNPLILACLAGIALNLSGVGLPGWSQDTVELLGRAALPLGLVAVGVALRPAALLRIDRGLLATNSVKLLLMPALVLALTWILQLDPVSRDVALLFAALPTATSAYILARQLGGDAELMAAIITGQTLLAMLTLPLWLQLVS